MFFGLHPLLNELQLKYKINKYLALCIKALWFDVAMFITWKVVFAITTNIPIVDTYILPIILVLGSIFFIWYDYVVFAWRVVIQRIIKRIIK